LDRKGSVRRGKAKAHIAKLHAAVADQRKDWVEKTTTSGPAPHHTIRRYPGGCRSWSCIEWS